jgi:hypothetical protein
MPVINGIPILTTPDEILNFDPVVTYQGVTSPPRHPGVPFTAFPTTPPNFDPTVRYQGNSFPDDNIILPSAGTDQSNNPSLITLGNVTLPASTLIMISDKKNIAQSQILDGVSVFEHVNRGPAEITLDFTITEGRVKGNEISDSSGGFSTPISNQFDRSFPQQQANFVWTNLWLPNTVVSVTNTYLNGLGIMSVIIEDIQVATVRGSLNIPVKIRAWENQPGQTIII